MITVNGEWSETTQEFGGNWWIFLVSCSNGLEGGSYFDV